MLHTREAVGPPSRSVAIRAFFIAMMDGYDTLMIAFIAPLLGETWGLTHGQIGLLFAAGYGGAVIGGLALGPLGDRWGRRWTLVGGLATASVATLACAAADSLAGLLALRFVAGIGLGGAIPAIIALTAEAARPGRRSGTVTLMYIGFPLGAVVGGAITSALLHLGAASIFLGAGLACLVATAVGATMPESPSARRSHAGSGMFTLFTAQFGEGRLVPAIALWIGLFSTLVLTYFLVSWTPTILIAEGADHQRAALGPVVINLGGIAGALVTVRAIDRFGPYFLNAGFALAGSLVILLVANLPAGPMVTLAALFVIGFLLLGAQLNFPAMTADLFPEAVRSAGGGWTAGIGRLGSIAGPLLGGMLIATAIEPRALLGFAAAPGAVAALAVLVAAFSRPGASRMAG
jgi:AAHS family 4-hydroxybenzoate transporter-like MFS transporter